MSSTAQHEAGTPTVSVVLPTYNRARTLPRAIRSVLQQSFRDLELLVIDDGSSDSTDAVVASLSDPRLRFIRRERNGGVAAARNTGVALARGEFIAFVDSDDEWLLDKLDKQVAVLRLSEHDPDTGLALCGLLAWDGRQVSYLPHRARTGARTPDIRSEILRNNYALTSAWCVRRRHFEQVGPFDESLPPLEDWEWLIRYTSRFRAVLVDEPQCMIYRSPDSISANQQKYIRALEGILRKHGEDLKAVPSGLAVLHYALGKKYSLHDDAGKARNCYLTAARTYPWDWRFWAAWGLSFAGGRLFRVAWRTVRRLKGYRAT